MSSGGVWWQGVQFTGSDVKASSLVGQLIVKAIQNYNTRLNKTPAIAAHQCTGKMEADTEKIIYVTVQDVGRIFSRTLSTRPYLYRSLATILTTEQYVLTLRHRASSILGQAFRYSPENAFYIFNRQIYFII